MKTMRMRFLIPLTLLLVAGALQVPTAKAEIRVNATVHAPGFSVQIDNGPRGQYGLGYRRAPLPIRRHMPQIRLVRHDRQIAKRLSKYTGVPKRALLRHRSHGYTWRQIGRWLELPRPAIRAAMHKDTWKRYLNRRHGRGTCMLERYPDDRHDRDDYGRRGSGGRPGRKGGRRHR